jgi:hypothetical protein
MDIAVNQRMKPESKSSNESKVEAMMAKEPLITQAYTLAAKMTKLATFEIWMANLSPRFVLSRSSCNTQVDQLTN